MRIVLADAGPVHYLVLIGLSDILGALFERVVVPSIVRDELAQPQTPAVVRTWIESPPVWIEFYRVGSGHDEIAALERPDDGERAVILAAVSLDADLLLIDDRHAARIARQLGFRVIGTLRVLHMAASRGLIDLVDSFERIKRTNFRYRQEVLDQLLREPMVQRDPPTS